MMESWVSSIGTAPIATLIFVMGAVIVFLWRHNVSERKTDQETIQRLQREHQAELREMYRETRDLTVATNAALSSTSQGLTAAAASMNSARETMQVTTAVMERIGR